jgi:iron complex outermembrane receptor protein
VRFYAKGFDRDNAKLGSGATAEDGQRHLQGGMRSDWKLAANQSLTASADVYSDREHTLAALSQQPRNARLSGGNFNGHWNWSPGARSTVSALLTYDRYRRALPDVFDETRDTYDLGAQHEFWLGDANDFTYGLGFRSTHDRTGGPPLLIIFDPATRTLRTWSAFVQDQIHFAGDAVIWTVGSKFEHNDSTGFEIQPGMRIGWQITPAWFTWSAVSRAVRTPNRIDEDIAIFCPPPDGFPGLCPGDTRFRIGNPEFDSEKLTAYEWGLRWSDGRYLAADLATFFNRYTDLRSSEGSGLDISFENRLRGNGSGAEVTFTWRPAARFDLRAFYAWLDLDADPEDGSTDVSSGPNIEGSSARHNAALFASWQPTAQWSAASMLRYAGARPRTAAPSATSGAVDVPAYVELDLRAAWRPWQPLEIALSGRNLLHDQHPEFGAAATRSELERSGLVEITWEWQ